MNVLATATGTGVDFTGISLPFSASDLLQSAMDLMGVVGPFVLLGLAIVFTPKIIGLVRKSAATNSKN